MRDFFFRKADTAYMYLIYICIYKHNANFDREYTKNRNMLKYKIQMYIYLNKLFQYIA